MKQNNSTALLGYSFQSIDHRNGTKMINKCIHNFPLKSPYDFPLSFPLKSGVIAIGGLPGFPKHHMDSYGDVLGRIAFGEHQENLVFNFLAFF